MPSLDISLTLVRGHGWLSPLALHSAPLLLFFIPVMSVMSVSLSVSHLSCLSRMLHPSIMSVHPSCVSIMSVTSVTSVRPVRHVCLSVCFKSFLLLLLDAKHPNIHQQRNSLHYIQYPPSRQWVPEEAAEFSTINSIFRQCQKSRSACQKLRFGLLQIKTGLPEIETRPAGNRVRPAGNRDSACWKSRPGLLEIETRPAANRDQPA